MPARSRWRFLITPRWLAWHAFAILAAWGMLWLGDWQFHRAENGNALSWAYTFEWPVFVLFGLVFWAKTIIDEYRHPGGSKAHTAQMAKARDPLALPVTAHIARTAFALDDDADSDRDDDAQDDPDLAAYNAYLARLNKGDRRKISGAF